MIKEREIVEKVLQISGFKELNPVQKLALKKGLLKGKNLVVSAPTASGKTLIGEIAGLNTFFNKRKKMLYLCPLVALANEKFQNFKRKYEKLGIRVALSVGDLDSADPFLVRYDWIICSNEKADSLIRHSAPWIEDVGLVIIDEVHLLTDPSRGPTLEILITKLRDILPDAQFIALSATIANARELAKWLDAKLVQSDWRPVKLYEGVAYDSRIKFFEKEDYELDSTLPLEEAIVKNTMQLRRQAFFFVATRRSAEALAERTGKIVKNFLGKNEKELAKKLANEVENVLEVPTKQCKRLAKCVRNGVAFHHAGLTLKQKRLVEEYFKKGLIKVICCTPTLAMGVSFPADRSVIRDAKRYYPGYGSAFIPVLEYYQMKGRAGRPEFMSYGEAILVARNEDEADELVERYILGKPEDITSKLAVEPVLRMHTLALIATSIRKEKSLLEFFSKTFYAFQYGDISLLNEKILEILEKLVEWGFVVRSNGKLKPTKIGKRVSELYIDPLTAHGFIVALEVANRKKLTSFSFLHLISNTLEMRPLLNVRTGEFAELNEVIGLREEEFLQEIPEEWDLNFDDFLRSVKTALMFEDWINEKTEDEILTKYNVTPGELYGRLQNADWLLYALHELALLLGKKELLRSIRKVRLRVKYGVKEELLPLVRLRSVGRTRARKLYNAGLKTLKDLREIPIDSLSRLIGPKIAYNIKGQLGERVKKPKEEKQRTLG